MQIFQVCPAYAGMIPVHLCVSCHMLCLSRVCGDDPYTEYYKEYHTLVCPAYAGMIPPTVKIPDNTESLSRVCGDDPVYRSRLIGAY